MNPPNGELPPQDRAAEIAVLGAVLKDNRIFDDIRPLVSAEDFYFDAHQKVFATVADLLAAGAPADLVTVFSRAGGPDVTAQLLGDCWEAAGVGANAVYHAGMVREKASARRLIHLCGEMSRAAFGGEPAAELAARFEDEVFRVADASVAAGLTPLSAAVADVMRSLDDRAAGLAPRHLPTGLVELDAVIGGLKPGAFEVCGARPGAGKSMFGLHCALASARQGVPALVVSMEMSAQEWAARAMAAGCEVPLNQITGMANLAPDSATALVRGQDRCSVPVWVDDRAGHTAATIAAVARRAARKHKVGLVVVDYLGLIDHAGYKSDNLATRVGNTSRTLKVLARQLGVPVLCLAQLNREIEKRGDGMPQLSDLRDSGAIEQDADDIFFLWPNQQDEHDMRICVAKQRNGPCAVVNVRCERPFVRFRNKSFGIL